jgi:hypothetical protein
MNLEVQENARFPFEGSCSSLESIGIEFIKCSAVMRTIM